MLGRWKKFLGVFLAFAMVIAMMTGNTLRVSAAGENEIDSVTITDIPEIVAGGTIAEANVTVEVPEGATAETKWEVWGTVEGEEEDSYEDWVEVTDDTFSATDVYRCFVVFTAQEGYCFSEECVVNGPEEWEPVTELNEGTSFKIEIGEYTLPTVDQFVIELPVVKAGESLFEEEYELDGEDYDYTVSLTWIDEEGKAVVDATFVAGKTYILQLLYQLKNGAVLADGFTFFINDEPYDEYGEGIKLGEDRTWAQLEITYVVKGEITPEITITALPEFKEGAAIADANVKLEVMGVPKGSVTAETQWQVWGTIETEDGEEENWIEVTEGAFSDKEVYRCFVLITATGDYCFSEDYVVTDPEGMMIGGWGSEPDEDGNYTIIEIDLGEYTKTTVIDKVEVTASEVKAGNTASVGEIVYWSGEEQVAGAQLKSWKWCEESEEESVDVFKSDKNYQLDLELEAKEGYSFANDAELYVNGKEAGTFFYPCHVEAFASFSTLPPVEHVEIINFPEVKEGEPVFTEVTMDCECEDCELLVEWYDEEDEEVADETFVAGNTYTLQLEYTNSSGATLSDDFVFIIDDITHAPTKIDAENGQAWLEFVYVVKADTTVMKQVIPSVNITALPEIAAGAAIKNANATVKVPEDRATAVTKWQVWDTIEEDWIDVTEGSFSNTDIYRCFAVVTAKDGYCFSDYYSIYPEEVSENNIEKQYDEDNNITSLEISLGEYTLTTVIDKVEVTVPEVKAGKEASIGEIVYWSGNVKVTDGVNLSVCEWSEVSSGDSELVTKFEKERNYQLDIELDAVKGYSFATDVEVYINGEVEDVTSDPCCVDICKSYSLLSPVDHVELKVPDVKEGASIFEADKIVCDCENCEDCKIQVFWSEIIDESEEYVKGTTFVAGETYKLEIVYDNTSGAFLTEDFVFIIDGKKYKATDVQAESSRANLEIIYVIGKNVTVTAISRTLIDDVTVADITVKVDDDTYTCEKQLPIGSEVTVSVTDENFINWLNKNDKIVTDKDDYTFIVTGDVELTMSKKGTAGSSALVEFVSEYNQVMDSKIYTGSDNIVLPAGPSKMGYTFTGWSLTEGEIRAKITAGETHITVKPEYIQDTSKTYKVTVFVNGKKDDNQTEEGILPGSTKTVNAPNVEGKVFQQWEDEQGTILGYGSSYSMQVSKDVVINAVYGDATVEAEPVIAMTNVFTTDLNNKKKISFSVTRDVPDGYEVVEHGMLYNTSGMSPEPTKETFVIGADGVNEYEYDTTAPKGVFTLNVDVTNKESTKVAARGYMIVKNKSTEHEDIYYSGVEYRSYN